MGIALHYPGASIASLPYQSTTLTVSSGFGAGMAEAAVFIGLTASVDPSLQAIALSGLFQSTNVGLITGLAASSAVFQSTLTRELEQNLAGFEKKDEVRYFHK